MTKQDETNAALWSKARRNATKGKATRSEVTRLLEQMVSSDAKAVFGSWTKGWTASFQGLSEGIELALSEARRIMAEDESRAAEGAASGLKKVFKAHYTALPTSTQQLLVRDLGRMVRDEERTPSEAAHRLRYLIDGCENLAVYSRHLVARAAS